MKVAEPARLRVTNSLEGISTLPARSVRADRPTVRWWLLAALGLNLLFALRTMAPAFRPDVVQDDVRQHVFWMVRFRDPELFRDDLVADYYRAVAPPGYVALYRALSWAIDPLLASKLLPPLLGTVAGLFTFLLTRQLHPAPLGAYVATVLLSWYVWQYDDLSSATPRAFLLPLLAAQLWALASGRLLLAGGLAAGAALVYPIASALGVALLGARLVEWRGLRPRLAQARLDWAVFMLAAVVAASTILLSQRAATPFGPPVSGAEARAMADFGTNGRFPVFLRDSYTYWVSSPNSGLDLRRTDFLLGGVPVLYEYGVLAGLLPLLLIARRALRLPGAEHLSRQGVLLLQLLLISVGLFLLAHLLFFQLYAPSRYVKWSVPLVLAVAAGLALGVLAEALITRLGVVRPGRYTAGLALGLAIVLAVYPARFDGVFNYDLHPTITQYLVAQPKDILVAGVPIDADSLPVFARRRVLTGREYALPFHLGYFREMRQRVEDLVEAYYAESPGPIYEFAERYGVDVILVNRAAFQQEGMLEAWSGFPGSKWEPYTSRISRRLSGQQQFALLDLADRCAAVDDGQVAIVAGTCLRDGR